jgi:hypothetical protein
MTFLAGHALPTRVFDYSKQSRSRYDRSLAQLSVSEMPRALGARVLQGRIQFTIAAPRDMPYALALWSDASRLRLTPGTAIAAGRAGVVVPVRLRRGVQTITLRCAGCSTSVLPYAT